MILEAEGSPSLPPISQRTRRAGGIIQSEPEGLRTRTSMLEGWRTWLSPPKHTANCPYSAFFFYSDPQRIG